MSSVYLLLALVATKPNSFARWIYHLAALQKSSCIQLMFSLCDPPLQITIPEVRRYRSYEEPDETPNRGAQFGSWLPHVMWYFVSQQRGCKWVFVWSLQRSIKFQTPRRRDLHQQAQTNGVVKRSSMGVRAHETPNQGAQFGKCWHWPALLPLQLASLYSAIANSMQTL